MTEQTPPPYSLDNLTGQPPARKRPRWPWIAAAAAVAVAVALVSAGYALAQDDTPAPAAVAATTPAAEPTPTSSPVDWSRDGCSRLSALSTVDFDPSRSLTAGRSASYSPHPGIAEAGEALEAAASRPDADEPGDGPLAIAQAQLDLAEACAVVFGDGPW